MGRKKRTVRGGADIPNIDFGDWSSSLLLLHTFMIMIAFSSGAPCDALPKQRKEKHDKKNNNKTMTVRTEAEEEEKGGGGGGGEEEEE